MNHPFQCIATAKPSAAALESSEYLLAACGPTLLSVCLISGDIITKWVPNAPGKASTNVAGDADDHYDEDQERPIKKQKTPTNPITVPNIIKLTVSPNNGHVIAVSDDKCVRVFEIGVDGKLEELSQRFMPKRPCAIQVLPDNTTILCGDKFGDVYSLPLIAEATGENPEAVQKASNSESPQEPVKASFKPSATNLTVHTQRNRKALEAQQKQKDLRSKTNEALKFEHKLLLGHVSMLTDLAYATREVDGKQRGYIITADRDEHIRVSRGPPQSHIIEGYCLGHKHFVSKLCVVPGTDMLITGGGDDWLGIWDWPIFKLRRKLSLMHPSMIPNEAPTDREDDTTFAISGLWVIPADIPGLDVNIVVVGHERERALTFLPVPGLLLDPDTDRPESLPVNTGMSAVVLDVTCAGSLMLVSFDARDAGEQRLRAYWLKRGELVSPEVDEDMDTKLQGLNNFSAPVDNAEQLDGLLYGVRNLRKRAHHDNAENGEMND